MTSNVIGQGRWDMPDTPEWGPAEKHVPHLLPELMYMGRIADAEKTIHQYKHHFTRRYINLDDTGQAWRIEYCSVISPWDAKRESEMTATRISLAAAEEALNLHPDGYAGF